MMRPKISWLFVSLVTKRLTNIGMSRETQVAQGGNREADSAGNLQNRVPMCGVHSIDQIEGVFAADQPQYAYRNCTPGREIVPTNAANLEARRNGDGGGENLRCEFLLALSPIRSSRRPVTKMIVAAGSKPRTTSSGCLAG
jgi:hypothetical protein